MAVKKSKVVLPSSANYLQNNTNDFSSKIKRLENYQNPYTQRINSIMDNINNGNANNWGSDQAFSQMAKDYVRLSNIGVAQNQALMNQYAPNATYSQAVADQFTNDYITDENLLNQLLEARNLQAQGKLASTDDLIQMQNNASQINQEAINALAQGRELDQNLYDALYNVSMDRYATDLKMNTNKRELLNSIASSNADRKQAQREADQDYELSKLAKQKAAASRGSSKKTKNPIKQLENAGNQTLMNMLMSGASSATDSDEKYKLHLVTGNSKGKSIDVPGLSKDYEVSGEEWGKASELVKSINSKDSYENKEAQLKAIEDIISTFPKEVQRAFLYYYGIDGVEV